MGDFTTLIIPLYSYPNTNKKGKFMLVFSFAREKVLLNKCLQLLHRTSCGEGRASQAATVADFTHLSEFQHGFEVWSGKSHATSLRISKKSYFIFKSFLYFRNDLFY